MESRVTQLNRVGGCVVCVLLPNTDDFDHRLHLFYAGSILRRLVLPNLNSDLGVSTTLIGSHDCSNSLGHFPASPFLRAGTPLTPLADSQQVTSHARPLST
jgi:hypothetical protein